MENRYINEDTDIAEIKNIVMTKVAQHAYRGDLEESLDIIPFEVIKGIQPHIRCCVYKEREIVRQRVRMSMGKLPVDVEYDKPVPTQIVHVIPSACQGCPIKKITVTSNCQSCIAKKCIKSCNFGAIQKTSQGAIIDNEKCKKCGACVKACPYGAIVDIERPCKKSCPVDALDMDGNDLAVINVDKCINCGACITGCPFGAVSDVSMMVNVIDLIRSDSKVVAMIAPAIEGQFGDVPVGVLKAAIKAIGFDEVYEVALGADAVAIIEAEELIENFNNNKIMTTSCCPSFVNLINIHYPTLKEHISTTVSPMIATARYIKEKDPSAKIIFIGPCVTKKNEFLNNYIGEMDGVLTFEELHSMFKAQNVEEMNFDADVEDASYFGKGFAKSGGVTNAVVQVLKEKDIQADLKLHKCNGAAECKKALVMLKAGKLPYDFIEGMVCEHGCINGPATIKDVKDAKKIFDKYQVTDNDNISTVSKEKGLDKVNIHRH